VVERVMKIDPESAVELEDRKRTVGGSGLWGRCGAPGRERRKQQQQEDACVSWTAH